MRIDKQEPEDADEAKSLRFAYGSIRQHTAAYVSIRQHTPEDEDEAKRDRLALQRSPPGSPQRSQGA